MPKSSIARRRPRSCSSCEDPLRAIGSIIAVDSVISTTTFCGSTSQAAEPVHDLLGEVRLPQLSQGEVESELQSRSCCAPHGVLASDLLDDPVADRLDQTDLLGRGDEVTGGDQAAARVRPTDQRLDPDHLGLVQVDDRLVVQLPVLLLDRLAKPGRQRRAGSSRRRSPPCGTAMPPGPCACCGTSPGRRASAASLRRRHPRGTG